MLGAVVWAVLFYSVLRVIGIYPWLCSILALIMSFSGVLLAFGKMADMPADRYICLWILYRLRKKFFCLGGDG